MNHLQKDIDSLESERHHLRENLKAHSVKKGDTKQPITFGKYSPMIFCVHILLFVGNRKPNNRDRFSFRHNSIHTIRGTRADCTQEGAAR